MLSFLHVFLYARHVSGLMEGREGRAPLKEEFPELPGGYECDSMADQFMGLLAQKEEVSAMDVFLALLRVNLGRVLVWVLGYLLEMGLQIGGSIMLELCIASALRRDFDRAFFFSGMFLVMEFSLLVSRHNSWDQSQKIITCLRAIMVNTLYRLVLGFHQQEIKSKNLGKIINLISNDFTRIEIRFYFLACVLGLPLGLTATAVVLVTRLGWWGLLPLGILVVYQVFSALLGSQIGEVQKEINTHKDLRIKKINEVVDGIRLVKLYGWEEAFEKVIN
jgi:ATP-binding cassette subfamily C (CFTR/MRP) protein 4